MQIFPYLFSKRSRPHGRHTAERKLWNSLFASDAFQQPHDGYRQSDKDDADGDTPNFPLRALPTGESALYGVWHGYAVGAHSPKGVTLDAPPLPGAPAFDTHGVSLDGDIHAVGRADAVTLQADDAHGVRADAFRGDVFGVRPTGYHGEGDYRQ